MFQPHRSLSHPSKPMSANTKTFQATSLLTLLDLKPKKVSAFVFIFFATCSFADIQPSSPTCQYTPPWHSQSLCRHHTLKVLQICIFPSIFFSSHLESGHNIDGRTPSSFPPFVCAQVRSPAATPLVACNCVTRQPSDPVGPLYGLA